ncbi:MAG: cell division/cell wall cluster transcriptional repressor MraZ [Chloroflexi bacterium]|nr:cell division/cell wall cluster transcriptional repressor MraZ [Chloroflexota bacterium]
MLNITKQININFSGEFEYSLGSNGRLVLPKPLREQLNYFDSLYLSYGINAPCIWLLPGDELPLLLEKLKAAIPITDKRAQQYLRMLSSSSVKVKMDSMGRIIIPEHLRKYAGISSGECVILGVMDRCEIWDKETWQKLVQESDLSELAENVFENYRI